MCIGFFGCHVMAHTITAQVWSFSKSTTSSHSYTTIRVPFDGGLPAEIAEPLFIKLCFLLLFVSPANNMSHSSSTTTSDVLASSLLSPIFGQSLRPSHHTPRKRVLRTPADRIPKKHCRLLSNDHINSLLDAFCCQDECLSNFSFNDLLGITQPYAELNEHDQTTFIINIMSVTCVSTLPECHFKLRLNGTPVCLTAFQKVCFNSYAYLKKLTPPPLHLGAWLQSEEVEGRQRDICCWWSCSHSQHHWSLPSLQCH